MRVLLILSVLLLGACEGVPVMPELPVQAESGAIQDLRSGKLLTPEELVIRLARAPRVIVGEQHDHPEHHALQLWLLQAMTTQRTQGSLLLEMLTPDQQPRVDSLRQHKAAQGLPDDLPGALAWSPGWDWALYGPVVRYALLQPYPLLAANLDSSEVRDIYRQAPALSGEHSNATLVRNELLQQVRDSHCGLLPESQMPAMLAVQQQRDRRMAERLLAAPTPALLFAGAFHARKDVGAPVHLRDLDASNGTVVLMLAQKGMHVSPQSADYVWYSVRLPEKDYCAQMRQ
ncbi:MULTISPECIES: ChaN family lipoprotein [Pseudomonas]|uniref:ChaN family lipoprotein n=1 Tax=Pseudomonas TaxID=286 RepID=UPI000B36404E|nr:MULTISPECIES: ChaN family lipoprotein [Pseudomonas]PMY59885.1 iron(III) ABC transporter [Pseudomonas sp. FW305-25]PMY61537.1 iron(III) ABC transporter [Pseudomonas sp. FW126-L8]PNA71881.1 iron(III) ABC transporter [Pseudomonas sp. FW305-76]